MTFLTNLKFEPKGTHSSSQAYSITDTVTSADGSAAYAAIKDVPAGIALSNAEYWVKLLDLSAVRNSAAEAAANANSAANSGIRTDAVQDLNTAQKDAAQENIGLKEIVRGLTDGFEVSGNPVRCNPVGGLTFDGVEMQFAPKQEGGGDPYPGGGGKNLLNLTTASISLGTKNMTLDNGGFKAAGGTALYAFDVSYLPKATMLTVSAKTTASVRMSISQSNTGYELGYTLIDGNGLVTFTTPDSFNTLYLVFYKSDSAAFNASDIQIELGSRATSYVPYSNIRPISGWDSLKLIRAGKNLFSGYGNGVNASYENGEITIGTEDTDTYIQLNLVPEIKNLVSVGDYVYLSFKARNVVDGWTWGFGSTAHINNGDCSIPEDGSAKILAYSITQDILDRGYIMLDDLSRSSITKPISQNMVFYDIGIYLSQSDAVAFEPYQADTYTVQIGETVYGGKMNWVTGELVADMIVHTYSSSDYIGAAGSFENRTQFVWARGNKALSGTKLICSHFASGSSSAWQIAESSGYPHNMYLGFPVGYAIENVRTWFDKQASSGTPVEVAYKLETPIIIQLPPREIEALQGVNMMYGDGTINVVGRQPQGIALEKRIAALEAA